jgi:hypothetical protein
MMELFDNPCVKEDLGDSKWPESIQRCVPSDALFKCSSLLPGKAFECSRKARLPVIRSLKFAPVQDGDLRQEAKATCKDQQRTKNKRDTSIGHVAQTRPLFFSIDWSQTNVLIRVGSCHIGKVLNRLTFWMNKVVMQAPSTKLSAQGGCVAWVLLPNILATMVMGMELGMRP